jgi:hypothetical protein
MTVDREQSSLVLTTRAAEGVYRSTDPNVDETDLFQHTLPGCTRQTAGNSSGPKVDILDRCLRHRFAVRDVGELQASARTEHTINF